MEAVVCVKLFVYFDLVSASSQAIPVRSCLKKGVQRCLVHKLYDRAFRKAEIASIVE